MSVWVSFWASLCEKSWINNLILPPITEKLKKFVILIIYPLMGSDEDISVVLKRMRP
jgi:hypothetical protein